MNDTELFTTDRQLDMKDYMRKEKLKDEGYSSINLPSKAACSSDDTAPILSDNTNNASKLSDNTDTIILDNIIQRLDILEAKSVSININRIIPKVAKSDSTRINLIIASDEAVNKLKLIRRDKMDLEIFKYQEQAVRGVTLSQLAETSKYTPKVIEKDGEPWWVAKDVCAILEIKNPTQAIDFLDDDERSMFKIGRQGEVNLISESGLYGLINKSRKNYNYQTINTLVMMKQ